MKKQTLSFILLAALSFSVHAENVLRVSAPAEGLLALPVLRMVETQPLKEQGLLLEFIPWKTPEQLRALILSKKVDAASMHTVAAGSMSVKGVPLKMLGLSLGNVLHVLSSNPDIQTLEDLKGKTVAVPFKGEMPDLLFRAVLEKTPGVSPSDVEIRYAATSQDAANLLAGGRVETALIADPHGAILLQKSGKNGIPKLTDAIDLQSAWNDAVDQTAPLPIAGIAAVGSFTQNKTALPLFWNAYADAVRWCIAHPDQAAQLQPSAQKSPTVAAGIETAARNGYIAPVPASEARVQIEQFMDLLHKPDPNPGFYWPIPQQTADPGL